MLYKKEANWIRVGFSIDALYSHIAWLRTIIYYPLSLGKNFDELYRALITLQTADAYWLKPETARCRPANRVNAQVEEEGY